VPTRVAFALATLATCAVAAAAGVLIARGTEPAVASMAQYRGRPVVMTFLYSTCRDTCPLQVQSIRGALDRLGADVPVLGVSVDPRGDSPERARRFVLDQRMTGRMRFLLGTRAALAPVWRGYGIAPQRGTLDHSAYVVLVDGRGRQRVGFPASELTPEGLVHDLRVLLRGQPAASAS
jgi:protein SCO1/2